MEWILNCFADIHDWVPGHDVHCKTLREDGKLIEFCGRSNKAGLFIAILIFYGEARRGCVMIPASLNRAGWSVIHKKLRNFLYGAKLATMAGALSKNFGGDGQVAGKNLPVYGN